MPRIFGTSWLAVLLATVVFFMIGFAWYSVLFGDIWQAATGITDEMAHADMEANGARIFSSAILITLMQALGLLMVINYAGAKSLGACLKIGFWMALLFACTVTAYNSVWGFYPLKGYLVDAGAFMVGYLAMAAIYGLFRSKNT